MAGSRNDVTVKQSAALMLVELQGATAVFPQRDPPQINSLVFMA